MKIHFYKYDGAGNDFIVLQGTVALSNEQVAALCHRRFGIGADGLMTLSPDSSGSDFLMRYYNSDGREATMCGNGGRCIAAHAFRQEMGQGNGHLAFRGPDGNHQAEVLEWNEARRRGTVRLTMRPVPCAGIGREAEGWLLDTGSPHLVVPVEELESFDVVGEGRRLRNMTSRWPEGVNVDFIEDLPDGALAVRTYERGVEDETLACGTGVTACALVTGKRRIKTRGGEMEVTFRKTDAAYEDIRLTGPVSFNFEGEVEIIEN